MANKNDDLYLRELQKARDELNGNKKKPKNDLLQFFCGLLMLAGGLFMIFQNLDVRSSWGTGFLHVGTYSLPNGLIFLPVIIGIAMLFLMDRKVFGWIVLAVGIVIILTAVILSVNIRWRTTNAYIFIVMFGLAVSGGAMVIRQLFKKN
ncbi:MAG: hypothetical protein NC340_04095 [Ruminococcus flavefaciens]|nr:hypothetical protein [Ruminococcus flavefaciens]MCM1229233.1 hypothetical protein [Ruminococcus flavefaciens]